VNVHWASEAEPQISVLVYQRQDACWSYDGVPSGIVRLDAKGKPVPKPKVRKYDDIARGAGFVYVQNPATGYVGFLPIPNDANQASGNDVDVHIDENDVGHIELSSPRADETWDGYRIDLSMTFADWLPEQPFASLSLPSQEDTSVRLWKQPFLGITENGKIKASGLGPGDYRIRVTGPDGQEQSFNVTVEPGIDQPIELEIE
ncbi:MAG: hypothetical protein AAGG44_15285, partial [Planctomycetota bacterium]